MKDQKTIIFRFLQLLALGFLLAYLTWLVMEMKDNKLIVFLIFAPNLIYFTIYFISTGAIKELELSSKSTKVVFGEIANEPVKGDFEPHSTPSKEEDLFGPIAPSSDDIDQVGEQGVVLLENMLAKYKLSEERPILMVFRLGDEYPRVTTLGFIEKLSLYHSFRLVAFVDTENHFSAFMPVWAIRQTLSNPVLGEEFLEIVKTPGRKNELSDYKKVIQESIRTGSNTLEALRIMDKKKLSAFVVTDEENKIQGVIEKDKIISQMVLKLAEKSVAKE